MDPERDPGLIHPGPIDTLAGDYRVNARGERKATRWLMGIRVAGTAVDRRCRCHGPKAAEQESQNENPAGSPGANCSCRGLSVSAAGPYDGAQQPPMSLHREDPLIGNLNSRFCGVSRREKLHHYPSLDVAFGAIRATFSQACFGILRDAPGTCLLRRPDLTVQRPSRPPVPNLGKPRRAPMAPPTDAPLPYRKLPSDPCNNGRLIGCIVSLQPPQ
jgi:hypothetical protein